MAPTYSRPRVSMISTYDDAAEALPILSNSPVLIIDCEGHELGRPTGSLTLLSIATLHASHVFLIDVLALPDASHPSLSALLTLFSDPEILKVFWDGRTDVLELRETYGATVEGVLDLQLVEVAAVAGRFSSTRRVEDLAKKYFQPIAHEVLRNRSAYDGIYPLMGLDGCLKFRGLTQGQGKDSDVVAMHKAQGSAIWARRPLPEKLVKYAAHDVELIAHLYDDIVQCNGLGIARVMETRKAQSARYVSTFRTRDVKALHDSRDLARFMPLGVIDNAEDPNAPRYECEYCKLDLAASCYVKGTMQVVGGMALPRWSFCRLCSAVARRNSDVDQGNWVDF